jgi:Ni,Fe-hydrogenase maturation factor
LTDAFETGKAAGTMVRLEDDQVPAILSIMIPPHQPGVPVMLAAVRPRIQGLPILHPKQR